MSFESQELHASKRKREEVLQKPFIELTDEELLLSFADDIDFVQQLVKKQSEAKEKYEEGAAELEIPVPGPIPSWKDELQKKLAEAQTVEELDLLTKEIVRKNKPPKQPKKKLMRVQNFYQRHIQGVQWMNQFLERTKSTATSRPFVERMLTLENEFKARIEKDDLLGPHLEKD